jgi:hypothetical protein
MTALVLRAHRHDRDTLRRFQSGRCIFAEAERNCFHTSPLIAEAKRCSSMHYVQSRTRIEFVFRNYA